MMNLLKKIILVAFVFTALVACKKDRVEIEKNKYDSMSDYLDSKKQNEQSFVITADGQCPIVGKEGTKICGSKGVLSPTTDYPYTVKLIELLNPKEMIYFQHSNTNGSSYLTSDGEIRLNVEKDGVERSINSGSSWQVELPNSSPLTGMKVYSGAGSGDDVSWGVSLGDFTTTAFGYDGVTSMFGWLSAIKPANTSAQTATFSFTSETDVLDNVITYIYLTDKKSLTQVHNQSSIGLPMGENVRVIMLAIDSKGDLYSYSANETVNGNTTFEVSLSSISESGLNTLLNSL